MSLPPTALDEIARRPARWVGPLCLLVLLPGCAVDGTVEAPSARTYYLSSVGDDSRSGTSPEAAWRTFEPLGGVGLGAGTRIVLESAGIFAGPLELHGENCQGTAELPIVIESSAAPPAVIAAGEGTAIELQDCQGIEVRNIRLIGSGVWDNDGHGLLAATSRTAEAPLLARGLEVTGFRRGGMTFVATEGRQGFRGIRLLENHVHHNGDHGLAVGGGYPVSSLPGYNHRDVVIAGNRVHHNAGDPRKTASHTGSGIVVGQVAGARIEHNRAFENGARNSYPHGGPVGIWAWDSTQVTIQFNESHHNRSGTLDGGGFDLDGGVTHSLVQFNYAHHNHGPGYLIAQFAGARPMEGNVLRYNLSLGDALSSRHGALQIWTAADPPQGLRIYNNTVITDGVALKASGPLARSSVERNLLWSKGGGLAIDLGPDTERLRLVDNASVAGNDLSRSPEDGVEGTVRSFGYGICPSDARLTARPPVWRQGRLEWPCRSRRGRERASGLHFDSAR